MTRQILAPLLVAVAATAASSGCASPADPIRDFSQGAPLDQSTNATANVGLGDLDGDGDLDIVLARGRHWGDVDMVLLHDGTGRFETRELGPIRDASYSPSLADVDGDGDLDIVVSNDNEPGRVYVNDGRANFTAASQWGSTWPTRNAAVADFNGDGRPDLVAAHRSARDGRRSHVCLNDGRGQFTSCTELAVGPATTIVTADFDRDGHVDLAVPHRDGGQSLILYNDGQAGFSRTATVGADTIAARTAAAGDLNGDGWPDLVIGDQNVGSFVHLNDGRGLLQASLRLPTDIVSAAYSMAIGDLNRDGAQDIVIGYADDRGSIFFNDGTGRSYRHVRFDDAAGAM